MHIIHEPENLDFERVGIKGKVFPSKQLTNKAGFVLIETETGHETTIIEHESDFIYYILEGKGYFEIDGTREDCVTGDLVVIPASSKFTYKGTFKMFLVSTPPWAAEQEEDVL